MNDSPHGPQHSTTTAGKAFITGVIGHKPETRHLLLAVSDGEVDPTLVVVPSGSEDEEEGRDAQTGTKPLSTPRFESGSEEGSDAKLAPALLEPKSRTARKDSRSTHSQSARLSVATEATMRNMEHWGTPVPISFIHENIVDSHADNNISRFAILSR